MAQLPPLRRTVHVGTFVHSTSLGQVQTQHSVVGVDEKGIIEFIEKKPLTNQALTNLIAEKGWEDYDLVAIPTSSTSSSTSFYFPGFVDAHIHASQFPNAGIFGKSTLLDWLDKYTFPLEASLAKLKDARSVYSRCIRRTLTHGTTTAAYYATIDAKATNVLADLCLAAGQRAFIGRCNMDEPRTCPDYYRDASFEAAMAATQETIAHIRGLDPSGNLIQPIITPRFALSCSKNLLEGLGALASQSDLPVQTHIAENPAEVAATLAQFPSHTSYTEIYHATGLLTPRTVLAHGIHLNAEELKLIKDSKASIAHCPASNSCLGSGICPVRELLDGEIPVGLGTDVSGGYSPSVLSACREACVASRLRSAMHPTEDREKLDRLKLTVEEALHLATRGGARCLGLEQRIGGFEVGMEFDAQYVALGETIYEGDDADAGGGNVEIYGRNMEWEDILAKWVFCGDDRNTRAVWVRGRLVSGSLAAV